MLSLALSEGMVGALYLYGGREMFQFEHAVLFAGIVPILIAFPTTFALGRVLLRLGRSRAKLRYLAEVDPLTQLLNRRSFFEQSASTLATAAKQNENCVLMIIDADHFKDLNDSFGHSTGDRALCEIANVLKSQFRSDDLVARVGGEEFAILIRNMAIDRAADLAQRVVDAVYQAPLHLDNTIIEYTISCGLADTAHSYTLDKLLKAADDAMYRAKKLGRNQVSVALAA